jgi:hypothetical protein
MAVQLGMPPDLAQRVTRLERALKELRDGLYGGVYMDGIAGALSMVSEELRGEVDALRQIVGPGFRYKGVWSYGCEAVPGDVYTSSGSLWYCEQSTGTKPGSDSVRWILAAKKGRDSRDRVKREPAE